MYEAAFRSKRRRHREEGANPSMGLIFRGHNINGGKENRFIFKKLTENNEYVED